MSWYVETIVKSKEKAQEVIEKEQYIPPAFKAAIQAQIASLTPPEAGAVIHLKTTGHLDLSGGNATFEVRQIRIAE